VQKVLERFKLRVRLAWRRPGPSKVDWPGRAEVRRFQPGAAERGSAPASPMRSSRSCSKPRPFRTWRAPSTPIGSGSSTFWRLRGSEAAPRGDRRTWWRGGKRSKAAGARADAWSSRNEYACKHTADPGGRSGARLVNRHPGRRRSRITWGSGQPRSSPRRGAVPPGGYAPIPKQRNRPRPLQGTRRGVGRTGPSWEWEWRWAKASSNWAGQFRRAQKRTGYITTPSRSKRTGRGGRATPEEIDAPEAFAGMKGAGCRRAGANLGRVAS